MSLVAAVLGRPPSPPPPMSLVATILGRLPLLNSISFAFFRKKFANSQIRDKENRDPDGLFLALAFFLLQKIGVFFSF